MKETIIYAIYIVCSVLFIIILMITYNFIMSLIPCDWLNNVPVTTLPTRCYHLIKPLI